MKKHIQYLLIISLLCISACRKKAMPILENFLPGKYTYDLEYEGKIYKDYYQMIIKPDTSTALDVVSISTFPLYDIDLLLTDTMEYGFSYFSSFDYLILTSGIYRKPAIGGWFADQVFYMMIPSWPARLDSIYSRYSCILDRDIRLTSYITDYNFMIEQNGKKTKTYRLVLHPAMICTPDQQHNLFIDEQYGIFRYDIHHSATQELKARFILNHFEAY